MQMNINIYGALKDYFPEVVELSLPVAPVLDDVKSILSTIKPESSGLLSRCRFAVNHEFAAAGSRLQNGDKIDILPPSSGG